MHSHLLIHFSEDSLTITSVLNSLCLSDIVYTPARQTVSGGIASRLSRDKANSASQVIHSAFFSTSALASLFSSANSIPSNLYRFPERSSSSLDSFLPNTHISISSRDNGRTYHPKTSTSDGQGETTRRFFCRPCSFFSCCHYYR